MIAQADAEPPAAMQASMHFFCPDVESGGHGNCGGQPGGGSLGHGSGLAGRSEAVCLSDMVLVTLSGAASRPLPKLLLSCDDCKRNVRSECRGGHPERWWLWYATSSR